MFSFLGRKSCDILAPQPGIKPIPHVLEGKIPTPLDHKRCPLFKLFNLLFQQCPFFLDQKSIQGLKLHLAAISSLVLFKLRQFHIPFFVFHDLDSFEKNFFQNACLSAQMFLMLPQDNIQAMYLRENIEESGENHQIIQV